MSEEKVVYNIERGPIRKEVHLAAQRFATFCRQFENMSEKEKRACIERADNLAPGLLCILYNAMNEYMD